VRQKDQLLKARRQKKLWKWLHAKLRFQLRTKRFFSPTPGQFVGRHRRPGNCAFESGDPDPHPA
jgi:hypothetical protein